MAFKLSVLRDTRFEALSVALTFVGMVGGFAAERLEMVATSAVLYAIAYGFGGWSGVQAAWTSLRGRKLDIDLLMILAALGALAIGAPFEGAMLLFLFSLSNVLQSIALGRSRRAVEALMKLRPDTARVRHGDDWVEISVEEVPVGAVFLVTPGDRLPLDGVVVNGRSPVDQASLTGESVPITKTEGDRVFAGTINGGGALEVRVTHPAGASALARMVALVEEAQARKAETQRMLDRFEQPYVGGVLVMTAVAVALPTALLGEAFDPAFYRAMTLMVAASPCALIISTPAAVLSAIAASARSGVLFKGGAAVEAVAAVKVVAFDKTGTLTAGETALTDLVPISGLADDMLARAASVQALSEHHLARATVHAAEAKGLEVLPADQFEAIAGRGVRAIVEGRHIAVGNPAFFVDELGSDFEAARREVERLRGEAKTAVIVVDDGQVLGVIAFADTLRPSAREVVARLRRLGLRVVMLTGDNAGVAEVIGREAGVDEVHADLLPEAKVNLVRELEARYGPAAMIGDGVNDAPALAGASVGVAMGAVGTDVALETADVVLMADDLGKIPYMIGLGRRTRRTLIANFAIALGAIVVMVGTILTAGLPLPLAVIGHEGSTVLVSLNGLRLLGMRDGASI